MKKVALIEDNPDNRLLVEAILEDDFEVMDYESGLEGIPGILNNIPDIILLDISLPVMDGGEVLKKLREHSELENIPAIALTAHAMAGDREKYLEMGFNDYLSKPITDEQVLIELVEKWV